MVRKTVATLDPMEVLSPADVEDSADFCREFVTLEEAEGYAVEFAKAVLFGFGLTEEAIERTVNGYANDMWLKQHPKRKSHPWKSTPKVSVEEIGTIHRIADLVRAARSLPLSRKEEDAITTLRSWLSAQEEVDK